jgi:hypothetical protein
MKKLLFSLLFLPMFCFAGANTVLQNAYTTNTPAMADAHVLSLITNTVATNISTAFVLNTPWTNNVGVLVTIQNLSALFHCTNTGVAELDYGVIGIYTNQMQESNNPGSGVRFQSPVSVPSFDVPAGKAALFTDASSPSNTDGYIRLKSPGEIHYLIPGAAGITGTPGTNGTNGANGLIYHLSSNFSVTGVTNIDVTNSPYATAAGSATTATQATNDVGLGYYLVLTNGWKSPTGIWHPTNYAGGSLLAAWLDSQQFSSSDVVSSNNTTGWITSNANFGVSITGCGYAPLNTNYYLSSDSDAFGTPGTGNPWVTLISSNGYCIAFNLSASPKFTISDTPDSMTNFFGADQITGPWTQINALPVGMTTPPTVTKLSGYHDVFVCWNLNRSCGGRFELGPGVFYNPAGYFIPDHIPFNFVLNGSGFPTTTIIGDSNVLCIASQYGTSLTMPRAHWEAGNMALCFSNVGAKSVAVCLDGLPQTTTLHDFFIGWYGYITNGTIVQGVIPTLTPPGMLGLMVDGSQAGYVDVHDGYLEGAAVNIFANTEHIQMANLHVVAASQITSGVFTNSWTTNDSTSFPSFVLRPPTALEMFSGAGMILNNGGNCGFHNLHFFGGLSGICVDGSAAIYATNELSQVTFETVGRPMVFISAEPLRVYNVANRSGSGMVPMTNYSLTAAGVYTQIPKPDYVWDGSSTNYTGAFTGTFTGNGSGLTNINAATLSVTNWPIYPHIGVSGAVTWTTNQ